MFLTEAGKFLGYSEHDFIVYREEQLVMMDAMEKYRTDTAEILAMHARYSKQVEEINIKASEQILELLTSDASNSHPARNDATPSPHRAALPFPERSRDSGEFDAGAHWPNAV